MQKSRSADIHPYFELTDEQRRMLWEGTKYFEGIHAFFKMLEENQYKIQYRVMLARYRGKTLCPKCHGTRLKPEAGYVRVGGHSISELVDLPITELKVFRYPSTGSARHRSRPPYPIGDQQPDPFSHRCRIGIPDTKPS